ncbi:MAG: type II toxin-antitoxin system HipA family toxin [Clostridium sp.]|nr:type II toxin-antitoxin system HipA family toxin [Clostridium sp.]
MKSEKTIYVYADYLNYREKLIGKLYVQALRGKEFCSFEYDPEWLREDAAMLDPDLQLYRGRQYLNDDKNIFGVFADSCPDRWGRLLMNRREAIRARESAEKPRKLQESDYLLGVFDEGRMGGIRFKTEQEGPFLSDDRSYATPPWTALRELEAAALAFESDDSGQDEKWLRQLLAPGSSLGGARPKASVVAPDGTLWIAKFPSRHDEWDTGAWEMTVHNLAVLCGLHVPEAKIEKFSKNGSTYLVKRFDRKGRQRIHFSSAMTMLGKKDGADASSGGSYLELVSFLRANGSEVGKDLEELWKRIVFSMAVSNTDDHFRNHGFLLKEKGWVLSPMYDVNPDIYGRNLSLNVDDYDSELDFSLALAAAEYYGLSTAKAEKIIHDICSIVREKWKKTAESYGISRGNIERMAPAFRLCDL